MDDRQKQQPSNTAFVLGNGNSRKRLVLENLKGKGTVYGCNALYREFAPDVLVAVDVKMVNEIIAAGYNKSCQVWTNPNKGITAKNGINYFSPHKGWSSGPTALWFASKQGHRNIYIFGFDYQGLNGKFNNIYADTYNYKKSADTATFFGNWLSQTEKTVREFPNIKFNRVTEPGSFIPDRISSLPNLRHITYEDLEQTYQGCIYKEQTLQKTTI